MLRPDLLQLSYDVLDHARRKKLKIVTAESCTGGLVSACLTEIPGSSDVFDRGFVTYSNEAKEKHIFVKQETIEQHGAVSSETAQEMASGALQASSGDLSVAITGIAGPGGGSSEKPVGLVFIAIGRKHDSKISVHKNNFTGDRSEIRISAVRKSLELLKLHLDQTALSP